MSDKLTTEEMVALYDEDILLNDPENTPLPLGDDEVLEEERMDEEEELTKGGEEQLCEVTIGSGKEEEEERRDKKRNDRDYGGEVEVHNRK